MESCLLSQLRTAAITDASTPLAAVKVTTSAPQSSSGLDAPGRCASRGTRLDLHVIELGKLGTQFQSQPLFLLRVRVRVQLYQQLSPLDARSLTRRPVRLGNLAKFWHLIPPLKPDPLTGICAIADTQPG